MLSFILLIALAAFAQGSVTFTADQEEKLVYRIGDKIVFTCKSTESDGVKLTKYDPKVKSVVEPRAEIKTLKAANEILLEGTLKEGDDGEYFCEDGKGAKRSKVIYVIPEGTKYTELLVPVANITAGTLFHTILHCNQPWFFKKLPLIWRYGSSNVTLNELNDKNFTIGDEQHGYDLTIKNSNLERLPSRFGDYYCSFNVTDTDLARIPAVAAEYQATPDVAFPGAAKTKSATKDEAFKLTVHIRGDDRATSPVVWHVKRNETVSEVIATEPAYNINGNDIPANCNFTDGTDGKHDQLVCKVPGNDNLLLSRDLKAEREDCNVNGDACRRFSSLQFAIITDGDRGEYTAVESNKYGENNATIPVKVKDKLAALWPFLGIVAEVVILCAIIFVYERRRSKTIEEEDEAEPMKTVDARDANENVRSRKA